MDKKKQSSPLQIARRAVLLLFSLFLIFPASHARAVLPVTGVDVPELAIFDLEMQNYMAQHGIQAGVLAVSYNGCVIYQRGFGYAFNQSDPLPENTPMRIASVEKPLTAAVIRELAAEGQLNLTDFVFDVGQGGTRKKWLDASTSASPYWPYDGVLGDSRLGDIQVIDLLLHHGGWDIEELDGDVDITLPSNQTSFDPQFENVRIANKMDVPSPPGRVNTVRYMMSQPLQFDPGSPDPACDRDANGVCLETPAPCTCTNYSNFGYMLLGLIVEQITGLTVDESIRQRILRSEIWVPSTEVIYGRTFRTDQNIREPLYRTQYGCQNVFDPNGFHVSCPYGGWDHESMAGHGNLVVSAAPLLAYLDRYYVAGTSIGSPIIPTSTYGWSHTGGLTGTSTIASQRSDDFNVVVLFSERDESGNGHDFAHEVATNIFGLIDWATGIDWASLACVDGFWADFNAASSGYGGYNDPFNSMNAVQASTTDGTKLHIKGGSTPWSGVLNKKMLIDARGGNVVIGQ